MRDVSAIAFRVLLDGAKRNGVDPRGLLHGLDVGLDDVRARALSRYAWNDYVEIIERLAVELGGYEGLRRAGESMPDVLPEATRLCAPFVSPRAAYRFLLLVADAAVFPMMGYDIGDLPDGRLQVRAALLPGYRECPAWFWATAGTLTCVPRYIGLPAAKVEVLQLTGRHSVYGVDVPRSRDVLTRARRWLPDLFRDEALRQMSQDKTELGQAVVALGAAHRESEARAAALSAEVDVRRRLEAALQRVLDTVSNAAFIVSGDGVRAANESARVAIEREGATLAATLRGVVGASRPVAGFEVSRMDHSGEHLVIRRGLGDEVGRRLERAKTRWALTSRQTDVLRGLVDGLTNAEMADRLGCAVRTVETHVTAVLGRADAENRLELVAVFWSDV